MRDVLDGDARPACNLHIETASVDGLEAVHYELLSKLDLHVLREDDPQRLGLYDPPS